MGQWDKGTHVPAVEVLHLATVRRASTSIAVKNKVLLTNPARWQHDSNLIGSKGGQQVLT